MLQPRTYEGRPLWGRAVYTALHGARLSSVPSGDQSANPASVPGRSGLQRAFLSVSSAQKCSGAGRLATPSGVFSSESTMFTSLPPRRLRWSAGAAGRSSPNCVPAPYSGNVTSRTRRIGVRVTLPGRRRICGSIVFGQNALMPMVQGLEGRPLWGRAVYTALHGARLSSVPSGDQSANPASVLGHSGL